MAIGVSAASAHHPGIGGIGGSGGILTIGAGTLDDGQFAFSAFVDYLRLKQLSEPTLLANVGNNVHGLQTVESYAVAFAYGFTNDLTVSVRLPWVRRTGILEAVQEDPAAPAMVRDRGNTSGFGDVTLLGQYRFLNNQVSGTQAAVLFGVKAPTGTTDLVDRFGELFEAEFQQGSGSWDGLFGAALSQRLNPALSFHANVLAIAAGTGTQNTNLGNRFLYNAALSYRVFGESASEPHSHDLRNAYAHADHDHPPMVTKAPVVAAPHGHVALDALLEINGEWHDKQRIAGVIDPNSGGNTIFVSPGLRLTVDNWSSYAMVGISNRKQLQRRSSDARVAGSGWSVRCFRALTHIGSKREPRYCRPSV
ncbi:transporter [Bradyrhizobium sp. Rc2d]|uniref:transporter n=1 Tax=Bradyrhizobium sp. Rc2d TaxID=1855321 RepID=UPI0015A306D0|nr:transporter [Bradyrhizobium sp. Rc2d]